jgi:acyl-CoA reductase-like NAD-dependent aldehyde dehydrogenase
MTTFAESSPTASDIAVTDDAAATNGAIFTSINPSDGIFLKSFETLTDSQLEQALATASSCQTTWKATSYEQRGAILAKAATLMRENAVLHPRAGKAHME